MKIKHEIITGNFKHRLVLLGDNYNTIKESNWFGFTQRATLEVNSKTLIAVTDYFKHSPTFGKTTELYSVESIGEFNEYGVYEDYLGLLNEIASEVK